jgi:signal transduction histidine kinase/ligand-binding sensor domain-containing protein
VKSFTLALVTVIVGIPIGVFAQPQAPQTFIRTHFTAEDGLDGNVVDEITQTADGFLWIITNQVNLVRFDGRTFYEFAQRPTTLASAPGGDLWIGVRDALIRAPQEDLTRFSFPGVKYHPGPGKETVITRLRVGRSGVLWVGTNGGLFRYDGSGFVPLGPRVSVNEIEETPDGRVLLITEDGFVELDGSTVVPHPGLADHLGAKVFHVLKDRRGDTWYSTASGVVRERSGRFETLGTFALNGHAAYRTHEDSEGAIWIAKSEGLFRVAGDSLEPVAPGLKARGLFSDRDGNLWVGTNGDGLYRFKRPLVRMFTKDDGLPDNLVETVLAAHDGSLWTGANCGGLSRFDGARFQTYNEQNGLVNTCVFALAEDANRDLWIGTWGGGAFRLHNGIFTRFSKKEGMADDRVTDVVPARDGTIWFGTRSGVSSLSGGRIRNFKVGEGLSLVASLGLVEDRSGVLWSGTRNGLVRLVGDGFEPFPRAPKSTIYPIREDAEGGFLIEDDKKGTVIRIDKDRVDTVAGLPAAYDMIETAQGDLWFGGTAIVRVPRGALTRARAPDEPLDYEVFSTADGLATPDTTSIERSLALTPNGELWVATSKGVARFDLRHLRTVNSKPAIFITNVTIGRKTAHPAGEIVLPAGTNHLQVDFNAVEVSAPEKIRLQYRLDDVDSEWLDAGRDPHAMYSTLPPGTHALHIRASNRSGIWDRQGVVFTITQQPFFYQTRWFVAAMWFSGAALVVGLYRLRVRQMSRLISARFDERLAERTRVARELHDTLLQTMQGSKMVAENALTNRSDPDGMVRAVEQLHTWLTQGIEEGRAALNSLRTSTTETNDLADAFRRAIAGCRATTDAEISLATRGEARKLHPMVRDEIYRIGYEAIRNACLHSRGDRIEAALEYASDLTFSVRDNGVGLPAAVAEHGKEGHFGVPGMKERAARIGARLTIVSEPGSGTEVTLVVPGRLAFRKARHTSA